MGQKEITALWVWEAGWKESGYLPVAGGGAALPVTVLCGWEPGPNVLISAGVHCAEYVGIQAAMELAKELEVQRGTVTIVHLMCPTGFAHRTMSLVYEDGKNLNQVFPGSEDGTLAERIAHTVSECLFQGADAYIDLHSGDGYEELTPYVYCQGAAAPDVVARSRAMAEAVDVPYLVRSQLASSGAYNHAGSLGIPGILLERGGRGLWTQEEVEADKQDVLNVLRLLGSIGGEPEPRVRKPEDLGHAVYLTSEHTGCWYPRKTVGDRIWKGEVLGEVRDLFGEPLETCRAPLDGVLLYQVKSLNIIEGGPMVACGGKNV